MEEEINELLAYAELEGSEWGDAVFALINLWNQRTLLSRTTITALEKEIRSFLKEVKKSAAIVEREEVTTHKIRELIWN